MAVPLLVAGLGSGLMPLESIDYWWTVKLGELIWYTGGLPNGDQLVFTPIREQVIDGQWLAQLILYAVHRLGGVEAALALRMAVALAVAVLLLRSCVGRRAGIRAVAVSIASGLMLILPGLAVRPQMLAVVPFLIVARAATSPPSRPLPALGVAASVAFWANVHGSFILAYVLLGAALVEAGWRYLRGEDVDRLPRLASLAALCAVAPLANPFGAGLAAYVLDTVLFNAVGSTVGVLGVEWGAPALRSSYGGAFFASVLVVMALLGRGHRPRLGEALLMLVFGLLALQAVRNVLWWGLVVTPYIARALGTEELISPLGRQRVTGPASSGGGVPLGQPAVNAACLALFALIVAACLPWWRPLSPFPASRTVLVDPSTPVLVAEYLAANPTHGELFNFTDWGAYLAWRLGPGQQVFIDDRFELHPAEVWRDYAAISRGHVSWEELLGQYGVTRLVLDPASQDGLVQAVRRSPDWRPAYEDQQALVFERGSMEVVAPWP